MPQDLISQFDRKYALPIETYRQVQNITQRNAIPAPIRWEGMMCYVISEGLSYVLTAGMENSDWVEFGALVNVTVVDDLFSTSATDALSANQGRVLKDLIDNIDLSDYQLLSEKGSANGYAPLDSGAKVPIANLPDSLVGQVSYQGTWAASSNTPTLSNPPDSSTKGHYYVASDNGTQFGISFQTGDWIISNGTAWEKVDNTDAVTSVFGRLGAVVANAGDYTFAQIGSTPTTLSGYGITDAVPTSRTITAGTGLTGGGDLTANRSFALDTGYTDSRYVNTTGDTMTGNLSAPVIIGNSSSTPVRLVGTGTGQANQVMLPFLESNGSTQQGYVGFPSNTNSNLHLLNNISGTNLRLNESGGINGLNYYDGTGYRTVWHSGNGGAGSGLDADLLDGVQGSGYVQTSRTLTAGDGLTGGGDLTANRSFAVDSTVVRTTGTQSIGGAKTFTSNVIGSGTFTGTNFILSSDRRLKKDIRDYSPTPLPIKWRTFDWKSGAKNQIGVIAQEVQEVAPHLVEKAKDGTLSVRMIDMLVAKVAELEARIINLER